MGMEELWHAIKESCILLDNLLGKFEEAIELDRASYSQLVAYTLIGFWTWELFKPICRDWVSMYMVLTL